MADQRPASQLPFSIDNILREDYPPVSRLRRRRVNTAAGTSWTRTSRVWVPYGYYTNGYPYWPVYRVVALANDLEHGCGTISQDQRESSNAEQINEQMDEESTSDAGSAISEERTNLQAESIADNTQESSAEDNREESSTNTGKRTNPRKRSRSHFTPNQLKYLETYFANNQYLSRDERNVLAKALEMTELQIRNWFQNKRYQKKHQEESTTSETTETEKTPHAKENNSNHGEKSKKNEPVMAV